MCELRDKMTEMSPSNNEKKIVLCISGWYVMSLVTLWTNRYVVAKLRVDSNLLSLAQLGTSVIGGLVSEIYLVSWVMCKRNIRKVLDDGLKDIVLLSGARILTVLLGLTALKYIAVSFTQTIKSSAPFFTVFLSYFLLRQRTGWRVNISLIPIVTGLVFCSLSDSSFHIIGFVAALMSNCVDCIQNVLTKRWLNRSYSASQLQLYTSSIAVIMQLMFIGYNWIATPPDSLLEAKKINHSVPFTVVVLLLDGVGFYIQSALAYVLMSMISPVTHSVANCVKRALIILLSIYRYGEDVTPLNWCGMVLVIFGVYGFNMASRIEREQVSKDVVIASPAIQVSSIKAMSEIRIEKGK